jgi:hypothetical protein
VRILRATIVGFVLLVVQVVAWTFGPAAPAKADCVSNFPWDSETELINYQGSPAFGCNRNFVTDPGRGRLLDPNSTVAPRGLLTPARVAFYASHGYSPNFLWYAPRTTMAVGPTDTRQWAACTVGVAEGDICPTLKFGAIGPDFTQNTQLTIIGDSTHFISLACGNFAPGQAPNPVPFFDGIKFRDNDRDGHRDLGEQVLPGWQIQIVRESSLVGQSTGVLATITTDANGYYRFDLNGHAPGRYRVEEVPQAGWKNYTPISYTIDVEFGVEGRQYRRDFGNAETMADVAKTQMSIVAPPASLDVDTPTDVVVSVTIENLGPAHEVAVNDQLELVAVMPPDCTTPNPRRSFGALLRRDEPLTREFVFTVTCTRPSEHIFQFEDVLTITDPDITDFNPYNNTASTSLTVPVHAYTDLAIDPGLSCVPETTVGVKARCDVSVTVTNNGFGPIEATAVVALALPPDCTSTPELVTLRYPALSAAALENRLVSFDLVCTHRSFHDIEVSAAISPDDQHVFDVAPENNIGGDGPSIIDVFHDATMSVTDLHLTCTQTLADVPFTCTATAEYVKSGPAPYVSVRARAALEPVATCSIAPALELDSFFVIHDTAVTRSFTWVIDCDPTAVLHSFRVTADINPDVVEPHATDAPQPVSDVWVVPYCLPTVNPHGQKQPQAPGSGMNEDGFYVFGTLPGELNEQVRIRDIASGVVFGPFINGTRIKWVEANGATPTQTKMGGNNGNGRGQALAVDYQILARGDAQAFFVDEKGVEVSVTCLVPPFPK